MINIESVIEDTLKKTRPAKFNGTIPPHPEELRYLMREAIEEYQRRVDLRAKLTHSTENEIDKYEHNSK